MTEDGWNFLPAVYLATVKNSGRIPIVTKELNRVGLYNFILNQQIPPVEKTFQNITLSCTDNHQTIYRRALKENYPYIGVFEDDVYFDPRLDRVGLARLFNRIKKFLISGGWDLLYLGHFPWKIGSELKHHPGIFASYSWCTHAYIISRTGMEKMLKHTPEEIMQIARLGVPVIANMIFKECGGIDTYMAYQSYQKNLNSFCLYPMMVFQYSIPGWQTKAQLAESMAIRLGFWPKKISYILIVILFLLLVILTRRKIK